MRVAAVARSTDDELTNHLCVLRRIATRGVDAEKIVASLRGDGECLVDHVAGIENHARNERRAIRIIELKTVHRVLDGDVECDLVASFQIARSNGR